MAFRAYEEETEGREKAVKYLITRHLAATDRARSQQALHDIIDKYGPVIDYYPNWHPLVSSFTTERNAAGYPRTRPDEETGFEGLDHTIYLRNGFITCPYGGAERVMKSVERLNEHPIATISAEALDVSLYMPNATPVLVKCDWHRPMASDGTIPKSIAVPLMLEMEVPCWRWAKVAETWETMRHYILGEPRGSRSSLFVNQETGQALKTVYNTLIYTGMFGPIYV